MVCRPMVEYKMADRRVAGLQFPHRALPGRAQLITFRSAVHAPAQQDHVRPRIGGADRAHQTGIAGREIGGKRPAINPRESVVVLAQVHKHHLRRPGVAKSRARWHPHDLHRAVDARLKKFWPMAAPKTTASWSPSKPRLMRAACPDDDRLVRIGQVEPAFQSIAAIGGRQKPGPGNFSHGRSSLDFQKTAGQQQTPNNQQETPAKARDTAGKISCLPDPLHGASRCCPMHDQAQAAARKAD